MKYVIVTSAHNEEAFIERTLNSVISQTIPPLKWIVVNDGSDDRTGEIVERYSVHCPFVELVSVRRSGGRSFSNKARAFGIGLSSACQLDYEYVGNLDADISLEPDYYERILSEFADEPKLGIAGGMIYSSIEGNYVSQNVSLDSVAGAVQLFRRACFEAAGGYLALPRGGIDAAIEIVVRKNGWIVRTLPGIRVLEHRRTGTAASRPLVARIREGRRLYSLGYGFLFFFLRCVYRSMEHPKVLGSAAALCGYITALIKRDPIVLPPEVVAYLQMEQRVKILQTLKGVGHQR